MRLVAVVFAEDFSAELERLSFHTPVWLADTPANRTAAEIAWQRAIEWPHISVTLFRANDDWTALVHQLTLQEKSVDAIDVIGAPLAKARAALTEAGYTRLEETGTGFRARK